METSGAWVFGAAILLLACGSTASAPETVEVSADSPRASDSADPGARPRESHPPLHAGDRTPPGAEPSAAVSATIAPSDAAAAEALFDQGRQLMSQGRFGEACPKFASSYDLDPATGTLFNLGDCLEKTGDTLGACGAFRGAMARVDPGDARGRVLAQRMSQLRCP